jgi:hypothetical protein
MRISHFNIQNENQKDKEMITRIGRIQAQPSQCANEAMKGVNIGARPT